MLLIPPSSSFAKALGSFANSPPKLSFLPGRRKRTRRGEGGKRQTPERQSQLLSGQSPPSAGQCTRKSSLSANEGWLSDERRASSQCQDPRRSGRGGPEVGGVCLCVCGCVAVRSLSHPLPQFRWWKGCALARANGLGAKKERFTRAERGKSKRHPRLRWGGRRWRERMDHASAGSWRGAGAARACLRSCFCCCCWDAVGTSARRLRAEPS